MNLASDIGWLKHHVLLLVVVVGLAFAGLYGVESVIAKHDNQQAIALKAIADFQAEQNKQFQATVTKQLDQLAADNKLLREENTALTTALITRKKVEDEIPKKNANLTTEQAAFEIAKDTHGKATPNGSDVVLDTPTAQTVVSQLELVPLLRQDKADLTLQNGNLEQVVQNGEKALGLEKEAHKSDNMVSAAVIAAKDAEIKSVKASARKGKMKWFGIGVVVGFVGRNLVHF